MTYFSHNVVNGGFRVPLRANVCESVYIDGMNVNSLGVPPQTPLDETIYSVLADETIGGQQEGGRVNEKIAKNYIKRILVTVNCQI
jgi:hypothetical protein